MKQHLDFKKCQKNLFDRNTTCLEVVKSYLERIKDNNDLNIFIEVFEEESISRAKNIDKKITNKSAGKLAGMIVAIKDNICYKNHNVSAASKILKNFKSTFSATVIERLIQEDAIIIGRLNCDEFAMGSTNENSSFGPVKNPLNNKLTPGGSSGGCAAAVAANLCHVALGSDTGGSIRQPASFCGVMGLKPTYGMVSRHGLIAYASSFDQIGPISKSAYEIDIVMKTISGRDDYDTTCVFDNKDYETPSLDLSKMKIAIIKEASYHNLLHADVKNSFSKLIESLSSDGHEISQISMSILNYLVPAYYILTTAEASSNLSRYDGIKYGETQRKEINHWEAVIKKTRSLGFGKEVKRRILLGTFVLSEGYYDNYYSKAQKIRRIVQEKTEEILNEFDFILLPTSPTIPFNLNQKHKDPTVMYLQDVFTVQSNLSGHPSLSVPIFQYKEDGPVGAQLIGKKLSDQTLLEYGNFILKNYV